MLSTRQVSRKSTNCSLRSGLLSDVSSVYLSYAFCKRSLMRENDAKAFVRGSCCSFMQYLRNAFFMFGRIFVSHLKWLRTFNSMESHGDVLQDLEWREASHPEGVVLQTTVGLAQVLQLSASGQSNHPRSSKPKHSALFSFSSSCNISIVLYSDFVLSSCVDVVSLLRCTRQSLGIMASSRGALIGRLVLDVCVWSKIFYLVEICAVC